MSKYFRKKKRFNYAKFFIFFIIISIMYLIFNVVSTMYLSQNLSIIFNNNYLKNNTISTYFSNKIKSNFNNPKNIIEQELSNYIFDYEKENNNEKVFEYKKNNDVLVYIYNSHQGEKYAYEYLEDYNIIPDVKIAAHILEDNLDKLGIRTIVEDSDILAYMKQKGYNHAQSYIASRVYLEEAIKKYPTVKLFIDLHRDAAIHSVTHTTIDGKECAKVLFVVGLENPDYKKNLEVTNKINNIIKNKYPSLTRGIMQKEGPGVNGIYNQDVDENVILLEVGGNENNIEEVNNTAILIAKVIGEYLNEKEKK